MKFIMEQSQLDKFDKWDKEHRPQCKYGKYAGAIGGRLTYCFTPTSLGEILIIKCSCGAEINVTNFDEW